MNTQKDSLQAFTDFSDGHFVHLFIFRDILGNGVLAPNMVLKVVTLIECGSVRVKK